MKSQFSRSRLGLAVCLAGLLAFSVGAANVQAQQGKYVAEASTRLVKLINATNGNGYKLQDNTFSIGGGWLKKSTSAYTPLFTVTLQQGTQYRFLAAGDADAKDVDLEVVNADGDVVASDSKTDPQAVVNYTAQKGGRYTVRVRLYASDMDLPCVCLAIVMSK